jgi:hypothetical protein
MLKISKPPRFSKNKKKIVKENSASFIIFLEYSSVKNHGIFDY